MIKLHRAYSLVFTFLQPLLLATLPHPVKGSVVGVALRINYSKAMSPDFPSKGLGDIAIATSWYSNAGRIYKPGEERPADKGIAIKTFPLGSEFNSAGGKWQKLTMNTNSENVMVIVQNIEVAIKDSISYSDAMRDFDHATSYWREYKRSSQLELTLRRYYPGIEYPPLGAGVAYKMFIGEFDSQNGYWTQVLPKGKAQQELSASSKRVGLARRKRKRVEEGDKETTKKRKV